jgi:hypothetical protein
MTKAKLQYEPGRVGLACPLIRRMAEKQGCVMKPAVAKRLDHCQQYFKYRFNQTFEIN